jgi:hypothetical protein
VSFVFVIALMALLRLIDVGALVDRIGISNTYMLVFLFSIIGGTSAFTAVSFYATIFTLASAGISPLVIALFSAPGILIGDSLFWYLGVQGRGLAYEAFGKRLARIADYLSRKPKWFVHAFTFAYTGLTPLPGDILMASLAILGYRFKNMFMPILCGNFVLVFIIAKLGS